MGDPWGTEGFRGGGEGLEGANCKKKSEEKSQKSGKNRDFFFFFFFLLEQHWN